MISKELNHRMDILIEVLRERDRQNSLFGKQTHALPIWMSLLAEEAGEAAKEANDYHFKNDFDAAKRLRSELVQVAAISASIIEDIDTRILNGKN